jgi:hypothetical protein
LGETPSLVGVLFSPEGGANAWTCAAVKLTMEVTGDCIQEQFSDTEEVVRGD